jgi:two-component system, cell cycle sensor histidine kinase and response regulator CckA
MARVQRTILLVEDEIAVRTLVKVSLEREGYTVLCADDAEQALALADEHGDAIDLLVTDLLLPGGNAGTLVGELERSGLELPVLYISGYNEPLVALPGRRTRFLSKPFELSELLSTIAGLLAD